MRRLLCLIGLVAAVRAAAIGIEVDGHAPEAAGARVAVAQNGDVRIWATNAISMVALSWETNFAPTAKVLGDAWERTYGDTYWRDHSRTAAEVMKDLYRAMREGAGDDVVIIGCNALNHLARAAVSHPTARAADWMETSAPVRWKTGAGESTFDWRTDLTSDP